MGYPGYKQPSGFEVGPPAPPPKPAAGPISRTDGPRAGGDEQCAAEYSKTIREQTAQGNYAAAKKEAKRSQYPSK